ncbi:MAG TPA: GNAT family N-acetyltransferase [Fimbriimonadaceae bacterium]|mgnify:CR=1 FL=1|nr:GNAT family N-acetyltransferase [Fimbriimonadaceae bacterium]HRJ96707.1 GNAT family N-acetyltransferase [Fimbriimonadaceae bacterium]
MTRIVVRKADLTQEADRDAVVAMTQAYARDPQGLGSEIETDIAGRLPGFLAAHPAALLFLACDGDQAVGIATCALSFSTFKARPILNIHDLSVRSDRRGEGIARRLFEAVEAEARSLNCCRISLEVGATNEHARNVYAAWGFRGAREVDADAVKYFCELDL